jgi:hypothetical protein
MNDAGPRQPPRTQLLIEILVERKNATSSAL